jgi:hypothetical protein
MNIAHEPSDVTDGQIALERERGNSIPARIGRLVDTLNR